MKFLLQRARVLFVSLALLIVLVVSFVFCLIIKSALDKYLAIEHERATDIVRISLNDMRDFSRLTTNNQGHQPVFLQTFFSNKYFVNAFIRKLQNRRLVYLSSGLTFSSRQSLCSVKPKFLTNNDRPAGFALSAREFVNLWGALVIAADQFDNKAASAKTANKFYAEMRFWLKQVEEVIVVNSQPQSKTSQWQQNGYLALLEKLKVSFALDSNTSEKTLQLLASDSSEKVKAALLRNKVIPLKLVDQIIQSMPAPQIYRIAAYSGDAVVDYLMQAKYTNAYLALTSNKNTKSHQLAEITDFYLTGTGRQNNVFAIRSALVALKNIGAHANADSRTLERVAEFYWANATHRRHDRFNLSLLKNKNTTAKLLKHLFDYYERQYQASQYKYKTQRYLIYLAQHANLPRQLFDRLQAYNNHAINGGLARNPSSPQSLLEKFSRLNNFQLHQNLVRNPKLDKSIIKRLMIKYGFTKTNVVNQSKKMTRISRQPYLKHSIMRMIAQHANADLTDLFAHIDQQHKIKPSKQMLSLFSVIAGRNDTPIPVFKELAKLNFVKVHLALVNNQSLPLQVIEYLVQKKYTDSRWLNLSAESSYSWSMRKVGLFSRYWASYSQDDKRQFVLAYLLKKLTLHANVEQKVRQQAKNRALNLYSVETVRRLQQAVIRDLAENLIISKPVASYLFDHGSLEVKRRLSLNSLLPQSIVVSLANEKDSVIQRNLLRNANINHLVLKKLANSEFAQVRKQVLLHLNTPLALRYELAQGMYIYNGCQYLLFFNDKERTINKISWTLPVSAASRNLAQSLPTKLKRQELLLLNLIYKNLRFYSQSYQAMRDANLDQQYILLNSAKQEYQTKLVDQQVYIKQLVETPWYYKLAYTPLTMTFSLLNANQHLNVFNNKLVLQNDSLVLWWLDRHGYVVGIYYALLVLSLILLFIFYFLHKVHKQRLALQQENTIMNRQVKRKAHIAEMLGHEIKSPLHSLTVLLKKDDESMHFLNRISNAVTRFSNIEQELAGLDGEIGVYDIDKFLSEYCRNVSEYKGIDNLQYQSVAHTALKFSPEDLEVVLDHIIDNASDFRVPATAIEVILKSTSKSIDIHIRNQGMHIAEDMLSRMFNLGVSARTSGNNGNLGQGLYIAREKLSEMGATIECQNIETGVEFIIRFTQ